MQLSDSNHWCESLDDTKEMNDQYSKRRTAKEACFRCAAIGKFMNTKRQLTDLLHEPAILIIMM